MKGPLYHLIPFIISLILPATLQARTWTEAGSGRTVEGDYASILLLNSKGREVAPTGYREGGPEKYIEHVKELLK